MSMNAKPLSELGLEAPTHIDFQSSMGEFYKRKITTGSTSLNAGNLSTSWIDIKEVEDMKLLVRQLTRTDEKLNYSRVKRGVFNFIGGISKILFGTMDSEDAY
jgi:hypothetical protein